MTYKVQHAMVKVIKEMEMDLMAKTYVKVALNVLKGRMQKDGETLDGD